MYLQGMDCEHDLPAVDYLAAARLQALTKSTGIALHP